MRIPFGTVNIAEKTKELITNALDDGRISSGKLVQQFEEKLAEKFNMKEAVAVSSGTDAITLSAAVLHDYGAKRGDEIIVPALSFVATGNALLHAGFKPVYVDVLLETLNIDPSLIEAAITEKTKAIIPVHLMGKPVAMDEIKTIAKKYNLFVLEDAAEAFGAIYKGSKIGTLGDMSAFSLYVAHIITTGEGGFVLTNDSSHAEILRSLRSHGRACSCKVCISNTTSGYCSKRFELSEEGDIRFQFDRIGYSCKMNELEAAIGLGTFDLYDDIIAVRSKNLNKMREAFKEFSDYFQIFDEEDYETIGPHAFPFLLKENIPFTRKELMVNLEKNYIDPRTLFCSIPTQCGGQGFLQYNYGDFPNAEYVGNSGVHIGVHQDVTDSDIEWLIDIMKSFILNHG